MPALQHPAQARTTGHAGSQRSPPRSVALHRTTAVPLQHRQRGCSGGRRKAAGEPPVPGFPSKPLRAALLARRVRAGCPRLCHCRERGRLWLPPRSPAPRGSAPARRVPVPLDLAGFLGYSSRARRGGLAVWEKPERRLWMLPAPRNPDVISDSLSSAIKHYYYHYCY